jgi:alkanesulfonate monooxygenase SsuD/methylene tetrahydromethanopterin reductase-like flavin-dependent oxidoreductase (luciferase family)
VRARCEAAGRDPSTLRFSVYTRDEEFLDAGPQRVERIAAFAATGIDRLVCFPTKREPAPEAQARFAEDCRAAGVELA